MVINHMLQLNPTRQAIFIVDRVPLVFQQAKAIMEEIDISVARICSEKQQTFNEERRLQDHRVIVTTAGSYYHLLQNSVLDFNDVCLLVFDECHHTSKDHIFNTIMKNCYFATSRHLRPKILGLTASPSG